MCKKRYKKIKWRGWCSGKLSCLPILRSPAQVEGWIFGWPSFPLKFTQFSIPPGLAKGVPAYMDRFEAAARGACRCAGGKLIIVKRLWAFIWKRRYINAPLYFFLFYFTKYISLSLFQTLVSHYFELSYMKLGYLESLAISNRISLIFALFTVTY